MDLQTRKLKAINYLAGIQDEKVFSKIEYFNPLTIQPSNHLPTLQAPCSKPPLTHEQLIERANRSTTDYLSGKFKTQEQLEKESENW